MPNIATVLSGWIRARIGGSNVTQARKTADHQWHNRIRRVHNRPVSLSALSSDRAQALHMARADKALRFGYLLGKNEGAIRNLDSGSRFSLFKAERREMLELRRASLTEQLSVLDANLPTDIWLKIARQADSRGLDWKSPGEDLARAADDLLTSNRS